VDKDGHRSISWFCCNLPEESNNKKQGRKWFMSEPALPSYSVAEVQGFHSILNFNQNWGCYRWKQKTILSRAESEARLSQAHYVVEGANLVRNEYGSKLFADFFFFTDFTDFTFSGVVILLSFQCVNWNLWEKVMKW
jgi:cytochrome c oxidase subunit 3